MFNFSTANICFFPASSKACIALKYAFSGSSTSFSAASLACSALFNLYFVIADEILGIRNNKMAATINNAPTRAIIPATIGDIKGINAMTKGPPNIAGNATHSQANPITEVPHKIHPTH